MPHILGKNTPYNGLYLISSGTSSELEFVNKELIINFDWFQKTIFSKQSTIEIARDQYFLTINNVYFEMLSGEGYRMFA